AATAAATPSISSRGLSPAGRGAIFTGTATSELMAWPYASDGHVHDFLVRTDQAVSDFHGGAERHRGLVRFEHHLRKLHARLAALEARGQVIGLRLRLVHRIEALLQHGGEAGTAGGFR